MNAYIFRYFLITTFSAPSTGKGLTLDIHLMVLEKKSTLSKVNDIDDDDDDVNLQLKWAKEVHTWWILFRRFYKHVCFQRFDIFLHKKYADFMNLGNREMWVKYFFKEILKWFI